MTGAKAQVSRLLALAPYLQHGDGVPLRKVADDFGVTPDQIRKDLMVLWMCGLPEAGSQIDMDMEAFEDDPDGLVRITNADYLTRPLRLGSTEAAALMVALRTLRDSSAAESRDVVDRVLVKLENATADGGDSPLVAHPAEERAEIADVRRSLQAAVDGDRQVELEYYVPSRDETTQRVVDPLALLDRDGHAYLDAWCHLAGARRLFRVDRIDRATPLEEPRARPDEPPRDLAEELFTPSATDSAARLRLLPGARWVSDYYPVTTVEPVDDGSGAVEVILPVGDPRWLVRLVLALAPDAEVLSPPHLAEEVARVSRLAVAQYAQIDVDSGIGLGSQRHGLD